MIVIIIIIISTYTQFLWVFLSSICFAMVVFTRIVFWYLSRITEGPFDPEVIQSEYSIQDEEIKVMTLQLSQE